MDLFQFLCDTTSSNITNEEIIKMLPPWKTKILDVKRSPPDDDPDNSKIQLTFVIAATTIDAVKQWIKAYQELTLCTYYIRNTPHCEGDKIVFSQVLFCHHNCKKKLKDDDVVKRKLHKRRRDTNCPSIIRIKLYVQKKRTRKDTPIKLQDEEMPCEIVLVPTHNHEINNAEALSWRRVSDDVKQKIVNLFDRGHNPGTARELLKLDIYINYDNYEALLSDRKFYPDYQCCSYLYKKYKKEHVGNGAVVYDMDVAKIVEKFKEAGFNDCIQFGIGDNGYFITVCTPLFRRVHKYVKFSGDVIVLDSLKTDSKIDRVKAYMLFTSSECGTLPLGAVITNSSETLKLGLEALKETLGPVMFFGNTGPKVVLTNDVNGEKEAAKAVWDESINLLSPYHVLEHVFKWLVKPKNAIVKCDQIGLFQHFKSILFARTEDECFECYNKTLFTAKRYTDFINFLYELWNKKSSWAFCYRSNLLAAISKSLLKDQVFERCKDLSLSQLLDLIVIKSQSYYEQRILNALLMETFTDFKRTLSPPEELIDRVQKLGENLFLVPSETQDDLFYVVNLEVSNCSCSEDNTVQICQHIDWLRALQPSDVEKERTEVEVMKKSMYVVATGADSSQSLQTVLKRKDNDPVAVPVKKQKKKLVKTKGKPRRIMKTKEKKVKEVKLLPNLGEGVSWVFVKQTDGTLKTVPVIKHEGDVLHKEEDLDSDEFEVDILEEMYDDPIESPEIYETVESDPPPLENGTEIGEMDLLRNILNHVEILGLKLIEDDSEVALGCLRNFNDSIMNIGSFSELQRRLEFSNDSDAVKRKMPSNSDEAKKK